MSGRSEQIREAAGTLCRRDDGDRVESVGHKGERERCPLWSTAVRAGSWQK